MAEKKPVHQYENEAWGSTELGDASTQQLSTFELLAIVIGTNHTNAQARQTAHGLLSEFQTLQRLMQATPEELKSIYGVGDSSAAKLQAALELGRRLFKTPQEIRPTVVSPEEAAALVMVDMMLLEQEEIRTILLNTRNQVLGVPTIYKGSLNTSVVRLGEVMRPAIRHNAAATIVVHNHPSGDPTPSSEDIQVTRRMVEAGKLISIPVLDHLIIGHNQFVSLRQKGLGFESGGYGY